MAGMERLSTAILRYPTGKYGIVGSIPIELTEISTHGTPQHPPNRVSMVWETEREAIDALLAIGVDRFQLSDCSWYKVVAGPEPPIPTPEPQAQPQGNNGQDIMAGWRMI
jgi:hypothetical protein|tara:strand:- start:61 stop:390 length:330 start_codon:yes stop_codon:yes gene_type:complete